jgi:hypothetical protein
MLLLYHYDLELPFIILPQHMKNLLTVLCCLAFFSCNQGKSKTVSTEKIKFDCNSAINGNTIYAIADSLINRTETDEIWNLSEVDTSHIFTTEDYFTNAATKNRLVLVKGSAGLSAGTANNLLILFACADSLQMVWAGQVGQFTQENIRDLNNDGIKEIVCTSEALWMGECNKSFTIFNFKNGKRNFLYSAHSSTVLGCGYDNLSDFKQGDTLETEITPTLLRKDKGYMVQQVTTIKVHNGGDSTEAVIDNVLLLRDTAMIEL